MRKSADFYLHFGEVRLNVLKLSYANSSQTLRLFFVVALGFLDVYCAILQQVWMQQQGEKKPADKRDETQFASA